MRYQGSEAIDLEYAERRRARQQRQAAPSFEVVSGGGLDAKVRSGVSYEFLVRVAVVCSIALALLVIGAVRVVLSTATVSALRANATLRTEVSEAQSLNDELKIERAVLSSSTRIGRIATQNYGMVFSGETMSVNIAEDAAIAGEATAAAATKDAQATDAATDEAAEGSDAGSAEATDQLDVDAAQSVDAQILPTPEG